MDGSFVPDLRVFADGDSLPDDGGPVEVTDRLFQQEAFRRPPRNESLEPFSAAWFARIESCRYVRQGHWLPRSLEFVKHSGESLLGLGEGLGTDWIQFAAHGADVTVLSPSLEQLDLIRAHFGFSGQPGRFVHGSTTAIPLPSDSIDVVCLLGLLHEENDPGRLVAELYRVLRPGGKVIAVVPAHYTAMHWERTFMPWTRWVGSHGPIAPAGLTGRGIRGLFGEFAEHRVSKRHLRRGELPPLWRWLPLSALERAVGKLLVFKAFKPLSAAATRRHAA